MRVIGAKHHEDRPKAMIEDGIKFVNQVGDRNKMSKLNRISLMELNNRKGISMSTRGQVPF